MRGEKSSIYDKYDRIVGSSPHARGKDIRIFRACVIVRIIPACAGKSVTHVATHTVT